MDYPNPLLHYNKAFFPDGFDNKIRIVCLYG